jgi:phosphate transport system permease protein
MPHLHDAIIPEKRLMLFERIFRLCLLGSGVLLVLLLAGAFSTLLYAAFPAIQANGLDFFSHFSWDPVFKKYSALPFITGSILTTAIALVLALPLSFGLAIFLSDILPKGFLSSFLKTIIDLLAGIPSVIYGFWGLFVLVPWIRAFELNAGIVPYGVGVMTASLILALMVVPYATSLTREVLMMVPTDLKEAGYALGATQYEMIRDVVFPQAKAGMLSAGLLAFGRALGETMAVTMVIGNANHMPDSLFGPANTLASVIANEFTEATDPLYVANLIYLGLILFVISTIVGSIGRYVIKRWNRI